MPRSHGSGPGAFPDTKSWSRESSPAAGVAGRVEFVHVRCLPQQRDRVVAVSGEAEQVGAQRLPRRAVGQPQHDLVGLVFEPTDDVRPDDLLGRDAERIGVASDGRGEQSCRAVLLAQFSAR